MKMLSRSLILGLSLCGSVALHAAAEEGRCVMARLFLSEGDVDVSEVLVPWHEGMTVENLVLNSKVLHSGGYTGMWYKKLQVTVSGNQLPFYTEIPFDQTVSCRRAADFSKTVKVYEVRAR